MTELCRICFRTADISPDGCPCYGDGSAESELDCFRLGVKARDEKLAESETKLADAVRRELAEAEQYQQARVEELKAREKLAASERENEQATIRVREGRGLLQRMVKYVREDRATTERATRLARLTDQVADYLQRTHDPRWLLRDKADG